MQGKTLYTILLSIIAVMALALAVLIILFFTAFNGSRINPAAETNKHPIERAVPSDEQAEYNLYSEGEIFKIKNNGNQTNGFIQSSVSIVFDGGKKNKKLDERKLLIEKNISKLKQATVKYFLGKNFEELDRIDDAQEALKVAYNEIVSANSEELLIIDVIIVEWKPITQ